MDAELTITKNRSKNTVAKVTFTNKKIPPGPIPNKSALNKNVRRLKPFKNLPTKQVPRNVQQSVQMPRNVQIPRNVQQSVQMPRNVQIPRNVQQGVQMPRNTQQGVQMPRNTQQGVQMPLNVQQGVQMALNVQQGVQMPRNTQQGVQMPRNIPQSVQQVPGNIYQDPREISNVQSRLTEETFRKYLDGFVGILPTDLPACLGNRVRYAIDTVNNGRTVSTLYRLGGWLKSVTSDLSSFTLFNPYAKKSWTVRVNQGGKRLRLYYQRRGTSDETAMMRALVSQIQTGRVRLVK